MSGVVVWEGNLSPSLADVIKIDGDPVDLTGCTVKLMAREEGAAAGVYAINAAAVVVQTGSDPNFVNKGAVRYDWAAPDVASGMAGDYRGWWRVTFPSTKFQDTPEFPITIAQHVDTVVTDLTTLYAAREYVLSDPDDNSQDSKLVRLIKSYSYAVTRYTRREWLPVTSAATRKFQYDGSGYLTLEPYDLRSVTSIVLYSDQPTATQRTLVAGSSSVQGEYKLLPPNLTLENTYEGIALPQILNTVPYTGRTAYGPLPCYFEVSVTGDWGVGSVPDDVELAVLIAIDDAYKNPTGFSSGDVGGLTFTEVAEPLGTTFVGARNLPLESRGLLTPYGRGPKVLVA